MDAEGHIYWSFTVALVKTDGEGTLLEEITVPTHHGDLWVDGDRVYVAANHPASNREPGKRTSWIYAYKTDDLSVVWKKEVPEVIPGAGGLAMRKGHFFLASGRLLKDHDQNYVYEYDADCTFIERHVLKSGHTYLGIQTMAYVDGTWWFGCYGRPPETIRARENLYFEEKFNYDCSLGIAPLPDGGFCVGRGERNSERKNTGWLITVDRPAPRENKATE